MTGYRWSNRPFHALAKARRAKTAHAARGVTNRVGRRTTHEQSSHTASNRDIRAVRSPRSTSQQLDGQRRRTRGRLVTAVREAETPSAILSGGVHHPDPGVAQFASSEAASYAGRRAVSPSLPSAPRETGFIGTEGRAAKWKQGRRLSFLEVEALIAGQRDVGSRLTLHLVEAATCPV